MLYIFYRSCFYSTVSGFRSRYSNFSREKCFKNFIETLKGNEGKYKLTIFFDCAFGEPQKYFKSYDIIKFRAGTETKSFLFLIGYIRSLKLNDDDQIYIIEDDYLHKNNWFSILQEGFQLDKARYLTLYDHSDKYHLYPHESFVYKTDSCYWKTTGSTTNSFATKYKYLIEDFNIHEAHSLVGKQSLDHLKFCKIHELFPNCLISSIPGYSTHCELSYWTPFFSKDE